MADATAACGKTKTLFIRNLPYTTTNEDLEQVFSDIGPVKSCFIVKDKESQKCRGFGYVKFTMLEDAEKATTAVKAVNGRNVHIMYANKKEKKKRFKFGKRPDDEDGDKDSKMPEKFEKKAQGEDRLSQTPKFSTAGLDTYSRKPKVEKEKPIKGQKQVPNPKTLGKRARLIIRNMAFKCTIDQVKMAFSKHGEVVDVHLPKNKKGNGLSMGFGFVQMSDKAQAGMAMKAINGTQLAGRAVAVDWALPKDKFESKIESQAADEEEENDEDMEVDEEDHTSVSIQEVEKEESDEKNDDTDASASDNESEESEEEKESEDADEDESDDESENSEEEETTTPSKKKVLPDRPSDVNEGRTLFVRNLPFTAEEDDVEEYFSQFGDVNYARLVIDHASGMPRGSAFIQYKSKEGADSCLGAAGGSDESEGSGLSLGGRDLFVTLAVSREQAGEMTQKKDKKEQKDTRNLYLAREGMIRQGTDQAKDVPEADLAKRAKIDATKRSKLKDQNVFVSSIRLCLHNIPATITDKQLRAVCLKAAGDKQAKITECRIMRDLARVNSQGVGKSRGYAFCTFTQHQHSLAVLRHLNNNPDIFGDKKRPVVEFSLENRKALEAKEKRLEKSKVKSRQPQKQAVDQKKWQRGNNSTAQGNNSTPQGDNSTPRSRKKRQRSGQGKDTKPLAVRKQQDKVARSLHEGPLGLPSHSGPKQRHKPRPIDKSKGTKQAKNMKQQVERHPQNSSSRQEKGMSQAQMKKFGKKRPDTDSFDRLVASYKQKLMKTVKL